MLAFYPLDQQTLFTNREYELAQLAHYRQGLMDGAAEHVALFGLRRIGKTLLLKEFMRRTLAETPGTVPVYMDFSALASSPENFSVGFVGQVCYWLLLRGEGDSVAQDAGPFLSAGSLPGALLQNNGADLYPVVEPLLHELEKARPDRQVLLRQAFHFCQEVAKIRQCSLVLILDEFQEIRTLTHYPNSQNVLALLRAEMQSQTGILYILAGSAVSVLTDLLSNPDSPLFAQFTRLPVDAFNREATTMLANKLTREQAPPDLLPLIHRLTNGHPFYITALCRRLMNLVEVSQRPWNADTVKQAFLMETLAPHGRIYDFCRYAYDLSLQKAAGYGALKAVLQILATEEGLTASQIARKLRVTHGTSNDYLRWLREVDLVSDREHAYYFRDPVLRFWVANTIRGVEVSLTAEPLDLAGLITRLDAQLQRVSEELGSAQESRIRELMRLFDGQVMDGVLFGLADPITLPRFNQVNEYLSPDGQMQLDAVGLVPDGVKWVVEIKWRSKRAGKKEMERLSAHAKSELAQGWFVSRAGFTEDAVAFAQAEGLFCSDSSAIHLLEVALRK
jgi:AAA+ ATPase superfamily predicted ATPase